MVNIFKDPDTLIPALAEWIAERAGQAVAREGRFNLVLSGGSSPKKLYEYMASAAFRQRIAWDKVFFFFGDERYVPADHPDSNYAMSRKALFEPLHIEPSQVLGIDTRLEPDTSASVYEKMIVQHFEEGPCRFDVTLLGLGDDAHTASLFPHTSVLHEKKALVKATFVEKVGMNRLTMTAPLLNASKAVAFLVYGSSKAKAVHEALQGPQAPDEYPAQLIKPESGELAWFLDKAAAALLDAL